MKTLLLDIEIACIVHVTISSSFLCPATFASPCSKHLAWHLHESVISKFCERLRIPQSSLRHRKQTFVNERNTNVGVFLLEKYLLQHIKCNAVEIMQFSNLRRSFNSCLPGSVSITRRGSVTATWTRNLPPRRIQREADRINKKHNVGLQLRSCHAIKRMY